MGGAMDTEVFPCFMMASNGLRKVLYFICLQTCFSKCSLLLDRHRTDATSLLFNVPKYRTASCPITLFISLREKWLLLLRLLSFLMTSA